MINEPAGAEGGSIEPAVAAALEGNLGGEPLVAAQWARPLGATEKGHAGLGRFFKRLTGSGDGLTDMMILAATPTRLLLFSAHTGWSGMAVRGITGEWPLAEASLSSRRRTAAAVFHRGEDNQHTQRHELTVITLPDGREIELPRGVQTARILEAADVAPG